MSGCNIKSYANDRSRCTPYLPFQIYGESITKYWSKSQTHCEFFICFYVVFTFVSFDISTKHYMHGIVAYDMQSQSSVNPSHPKAAEHLLEQTTTATAIPTTIERNWKPFFFRPRNCWLLSHFSFLWLKHLKTVTIWFSCFYLIWCHHKFAHRRKYNNKTRNRIFFLFRYCVKAE